jgi:hypothetical protein
MKKALFTRRYPGTSLVFPFLFISLFLLVHGHLDAQKFYTAETTYAIKLGRTKPIYEWTTALPSDAEKLKELKKNKPRVIPNFAGRRPLTDHNPNALPQGADPLFNEAQLRMPANDILPIVNFSGIGEESSGAVPPDVNGDIGKDFYVEIVNGAFFRVFDKSGNPVSGLIATNSIWSQVGQTSLSDVLMFYDQAVDRWLMTEIGFSNRLLVAISVTSDPRGSWDAYFFQAPRLPDFPKYGIWGDAYYVTTNESGPNFPIYAINRDDILSGVATARVQRMTTPKIGGVFFEVAQPVDWDGLTPPPAGSPGIAVKLNDDDWGVADQDEIIFHKIFVDWNNSANSNIEVIAIPTTPYDTDGCALENTGGFSCIPQPNGQGIDGAQWIICNKAQYRNFGTHESFVMAFMVDVTGNDVAGIRWMEFRRTSTEDWHIFQEGTIGADDGLHRFMPSLALDGQGNIGIGYAVSGFSKFPSLRYTGRYRTDPPGTMTFTEHEFVSGTGSQGFDRFGDYFSMSVDPTDESSFWFAGQFITANGNWATRMVSFRASRDTVDVFPITLEKPGNDGALGDQEVGFTVFNRGLTTVFPFPVGFQFNEGDWISELPAIDSLPIDQSFTHYFSTPVNIPTPGTYPLRIATFLDNDGNKRNDTLTFMITKYGQRDIALEYQLTQEQGVVCEGEAIVSFLIKNAGIDTVRQIAFVLSREGNPIDTIEWTGELAFGAETTFAFPAAVEEGINHFSMDILSINTSFPDDLPANNFNEWSLNAHPEGKDVFLEFKTDNFPQETTWELFDESNNVIASAGPFGDAQTTTFSSFCLDPEQCYTFTVYDAFGDGMSKGSPGDFEITNEEGSLIAELARPNFGSQSSSQFCLTNECLFSIDVGVEHETSPGAGDAIALGEPSNNLGTVQYSINGGDDYQVSPVFDNLIPGTYILIAKDGAGCLDTTSFEILTCHLQTLVTTLPAVGGDVGEIHVTETGEIGEVQYSLNGSEFVSDSFFVNLEPGNYVVTVRDSLGCTTIDSVTVSTSVSTTSISEEHFINVYPNPNKGVFQVEAIFPPMHFSYLIMSCQNKQIPFYMVRSRDIMMFTRAKFH